MKIRREEVYLCVLMNSHTVMEGGYISVKHSAVEFWIVTGQKALINFLLI